MQNDDEIDDDNDWTTIDSETNTEETSIEDEYDEEHEDMDDDEDYPQQRYVSPDIHTMNIIINDEDIENAKRFTKKAFDTMFDLNITFHDLEHVYNPHLLRIMQSNPSMQIVEQY
jgi:hypothetical protein